MTASNPPPVAHPAPKWLPPKHGQSPCPLPGTHRRRPFGCRQPSARSRHPPPCAWHRWGRAQAPPATGVGALESVAPLESLGPWACTCLRCTAQNLGRGPGQARGCEARIRRSTSSGRNGPEAPDRGYRSTLAGIGRRPPDGPRLPLSINPPSRALFRTVQPLSQHPRPHTPPPTTGQVPTSVLWKGAPRALEWRTTAGITGPAAVPR